MKRTILILVIVLAACVGGILGSLVTIRFFAVSNSSYTSIAQHQQSVLTSHRYDTGYNVPKGLNFLETSRDVIPAVVHIRTSYGPGVLSLGALESFFDMPSRSGGSGVFISGDVF